MRLDQRHAAGQLDVERELLAPVDLDEGHVVDLAHGGNGGRGGVDALAQVALVAGLDVHDDVASGKRPLDRRLDRVRRRVPLPDPGRGRDADHDVGELPAARLPHPQPAQLDVGRAPRSPRALPPRPGSAHGP